MGAVTGQPWGHLGTAWVAVAVTVPWHSDTVPGAHDYGLELLLITSRLHYDTTWPVALKQDMVAPSSNRLIHDLYCPISPSGALL